MRKNYILLRTLIVLVVMSATAVMTANAQSKVTKALKADVIDWGNVQYPEFGTIDNGGDFIVYGQVYKAGVTEPTGQGAGITAELGYSTTDTNPATWTNWISATYNMDKGNNDEYMANLGTAVGVGTYYYAYRYQLNSGDFYYAGKGGAWNNDNGKLTVNRAKPFITKWNTNNPSSTIGTLTPSTNTQIYFPGIGTNYTIEWENAVDPSIHGTKTVASSDNNNPVLIDNLPSPGEYIVKVYPQGFERIQFGDWNNVYGDQEKLTEIQQWGDVQWTSMEYAFNGCVNMQLIATAGEPDLSQVTNMYGMFFDCAAFNGNISNWDVSNVTHMRRMFNGCTAFNQPLDNWDVSKVTNMYAMFNGCTAFNGALNSWNVSNVTRMDYMFFGCTVFNQPLDNWDVSNVTDMSDMFHGCDVFNGDISGWNVSKVTSMGSMFRDCPVFNQPLNSWDVSSVTDMRLMFYNCDAFNQSLNNWGAKVSNVTNMISMFSGCSAFNQDISSWNVSNVTNMGYMFSGCSAFNQDLSSWNLKSIVHDVGANKYSLKDMFNGSGMDCANYGNTLIGWANNPETLTGLKLGANGLTYGTNGQTARTTLIGKGWTIDGDTYDVSCTESTGIETVSNSGNTLSIYPNPAQEQVTVELANEINNEKVTIADISGKIVYEQTFTGLSTTVNLNEFKQGVYFVKVGNVTRKLLVK